MVILRGQKKQAKAKKVIFGYASVFKGLFILFMVFGSMGSLRAQNVYLMIRDSETMQPVADVKVEILSNRISETHYSSFSGEIVVTLTHGVYNISFSRRGYKTIEFPDFQVVQERATTREIIMERNIIDLPDDDDNDLTDKGGDTTKVEVLTQNAVLFGYLKKQQTYPVLKKIFPLNLPNPLFFDAGYSLGASNALNLELGYYMIKRLYLSLGYAQSWQSYSSSVFVNPDFSYELTFRRFDIGLGSAMIIPITKKRMVHVNPFVNVGREILKNENLIPNPEISSFKVNGLTFGTDLGVNFYNMVIYAGVNYNLWLTNALNQENRELQDGYDGELITWGDGLFPGRKGLGYGLGIKFYIH